MVSSAALSKACTSTASLETELEDDFDTVSTGTSGSEAADNSIVAYDEAASKGQLAFGNVAITNSSDVHFGNKTYYQGPVTIKQFLYAGNAEAGLKGLESKVGDVKCESGIVVDGLPEGEVRNGECRKVVGDVRDGNGPAAEKPDDVPTTSKGTSLESDVQ